MESRLTLLGEAWGMEVGRGTSKNEGLVGWDNSVVMGGAGRGRRGYRGINGNGKSYNKVF